MRISHSSYQKYIEKLSKEIDGKLLFSPILINNETMLFPFAADYHYSLVISLNNRCPLIYKIKSDIFFKSFDNSFMQRFKKIFNRTIITNLQLNDKDNIVSFILTSNESDESRIFVAELIPNSPNLIVLNNGKIEETYYRNKNRNLTFGAEYELPESLSELKGEQKITEEFLESQFKAEDEIRFKEKYAEFLKFLNTKIKSVNKKISSINGDLKKAVENRKFAGIADEIYTLGIDLRSKMDSVEINGETIKLDISKTVGENCQNFYKKAKKAKETAKHFQTNIDNAQKSLDEYNRILSDFEAADEKDKDKIMETYFPVNKKKETAETIFNRPWKYNLNGTYIYFGKNASQNDYLSFVMKLDRDYVWMHIKNISGSHIVICSHKPTENELLFACEIALLCSHQKAGEIVYTKKKNVRRGHTLGEAIIKNQTTIKLNRIREETVAAFAEAKRCD
jgi:predicted ribosome quality control (RQC) complex YloA/Tae2 family protein